MANHKSTQKRVRSNSTKTARNKYNKKTCRTLIKKLRKTTALASAIEQCNIINSKLDKLDKKGVFHKNKSSRLKSKLAKYINSLTPAAPTS